MTPRDRQALVTMLGELAQLYGHKLEADAVRWYWEALCDLPLSAVQAMAKVHARTGRYFPKPYELRPPDERKAPAAGPDRSFQEASARSDAALEQLRVTDPERWYATVAPKVRELGAAKGMLPGEIESKLRRYQAGGSR